MTKRIPAPVQKRDLSELQQRLQVNVDPELLLLALTHRSYAYENRGLYTNERLEFLGDSILGQAVAVRLYRDHPDASEGELAKRRASVVSTVALAEVGRAIGLGKFILLGKGETLTGGADKPSILADTVEAIFGATYLSCGADEATALVLRLLEPMMSDRSRFGAAMDPKTSLQELASKLGEPAPVYVVSDSGPDHQKRFTATVSVGERLAHVGEGSSKKHAEMAAALGAWTQLSAE